MATLPRRFPAMPVMLVLIAPPLIPLTTVRSRLLDEPTPGIASIMDLGTLGPAARGVVGCAAQRRPAKTLSDADASHVNFTPVRGTVRALLGLKRPDSLLRDFDQRRIAPVELTTRLPCGLTFYGLRWRPHK